MAKKSAKKAAVTPAEPAADTADAPAEKPQKPADSDAQRIAVVRDGLLHPFQRERLERVVPELMALGVSLDAALDALGDPQKLLDPPCASVLSQKYGVEAATLKKTSLKLN